MNISHYSDLYRKDLELKNYAKTSIENYVSQIKLFLSVFDGKFTEPKKINEAAIKDWLLSSNSINGRRHRLSAIKLFYKLTIHQPMKMRFIEYPRKEKKLPIILSQQEIQRMFDVCTNKKHLAILGLLYSCGLRVSELINLQLSHIDSSRMVINILGGKGNKDRQTMLPEKLLTLLREYFIEYRPKTYLFNGQKSLQYSAKSVGEIVKQLAVKSGIDKRVYTHLMRHCTFSHMVENGVDIALIKRLAGHQSERTTSIYLHIAHSTISKIQSPISNIRL